MKAAEVIRLIEKQGWYEVRQRGSHRIFKHSEYTETISVPDHGKSDLKPGLLSSIFKTARIK